MKKTIDLVKDSILCTIVVVLLILLNLLALVSTPISSIVIVVFIGCYFQNKNLVRSICSSVVIFLVCLLFFNLIDVLVFILPSLVLGIIATLFLKKEMINKVFILVLTILFFIVNMIMELGFAQIVMNMNFIEYVLYDDMFGMSELLKEFSELVVSLYIILVAAISFMEVIILKRVNVIYKKRIMPIIKEVDKDN